MDIYTTTIAISIVVYIILGNYAGRGIKRLDEYYVAGRRAPTILILGTLVASVMSSTMFLGEAGFAYDGQAGPYVIFPQAATSGYVIGAIGCLRGMQTGKGPSAVGQAATRAVVSSIILIVAVDFVFAVLYYCLDI